MRFQVRLKVIYHARLGPPGTKTEIRIYFSTNPLTIQPSTKFPQAKIPNAFRAVTSIKKHRNLQVERENNSNKESLTDLTGGVSVSKDSNNRSDLSRYFSVPCTSLCPLAAGRRQMRVHFIQTAPLLL